MNIRPATPDDLDDICRLADEIAAQHHAGAPELFAPAPGAIRDRPHWSSCLAAAAGRVFIAESEGRTIIGFVTARITDTGPLSFLQPRRACRIGTLVVQASHHGQGCGRRLMMAVDSWARGHGADELQLEVMDFNQGAMDFYRRLDFSARSHILARPLGTTEPEWLAIARGRSGVQPGPPGLVEARTREHETRASPVRDGDEPYLCSWFVNWSLGQAGIAGTNSALARAWLAWGQPLQASRPGCVVVLWRDSPESWKGHVGLCLREDAQAVHVLGASQFHEVGEHAFPRSSVLGWRWPWADDASARNTRP